MGKYLEAFKSYMIRNNYQCVYADNLVKVTYGAENMRNVDIFMLFDERDNGSVEFISYPSNCAISGKEIDAMRFCNEMNSNYDWTKFFVDSDGKITVRAYADTELESVGQVCLRIGWFMKRNIDEVYPRLMKVIGNS